MKNYIKIIVSLFCAGSLFMTGCKTVTQTQQSKINVGVLVASQIGGAIILNEHPEYKDGFKKAIDDLRLIQISPDEVGISQVLAIVQRLDIKELKSPSAVLYVSSGILLLNEFGVPTQIPLEQSNSVKQIAGKIADGLEVAVQTVFPNG